MRDGIYIFGGCQSCFNCLNKYINKICSLVGLFFPPELCGSVDENNNRSAAKLVLVLPATDLPTSQIQIYIHHRPEGFEHFLCSFTALHKDLQNAVLQRTRAQREPELSITVAGIIKRC